MIRAAARWAAHIATALFAGGLSIRLTVRDSLGGLSAAFYATPWPVLAVLAVPPALLWLRRGKKRIATAWAALAVVCGLVWLWGSFSVRKPQPQPHGTVPGRMRVAYWNVSRPDRGIDSVTTAAAGVGATIFGIGEAKTGKQSIEPFAAAWDARSPGKELLPLRRNMLLAAPFPGRVLEDGVLNDRGQYSLCEYDIAGRAVLVLMADFDAIVAWSRAPAFARLVEILDARRGQPLILMGDFNTPRDSVHFEPIRTRLRSTWEVAGSGYGESWPVPVPVLSLDQIWVSEHFEILASEYSTGRSDHRMIIADIVLKGIGE